MDKQLIEKLSNQNLDVKQFIEWNEPFPQQEFNMNLQELKSRLEAELSQSIESHVIRKQKNMADLQKSIQLILNAKKKTAQIFEEMHQPNSQQKIIPSSSNQQIQQFQGNVLKNNLQNLVQLISIKNKVDYCLQKLQPIVNTESTDENMIQDRDDD